MSTSPGRVLW